MSRLALLALLVAACGGSPKPTTEAPSGTGDSSAVVSAKTLVNVDAQGVGLGGYDPVTYFDGAPLEGSPEFHEELGGATYHFYSDENFAVFQMDMAKYVPAFGGYCAFAAAEGRLSPADPTEWLVVDGRLLVFTDEGFKASFEQNPAGNLARADANWPGLVEKHGK
jgi:YHS domain-containing protein